MVEEGILSKTTGNGKPVQSGKSVLPLNGKDMYILSGFLIRINPFLIVTKDSLVIY